MTTLFTEQEKAQITAKSDWRGTWLVCCQLVITLGILGAMAIWPNPVVLLLGIVLLGGRMLGFFVLTHEAGHRSLFKSKTLNEFVSVWVTAPMDFSNARSYMREHLRHHQAAGTSADPDLANYRDYPISRERLKRKFSRDLTGRTGWRNLSMKLRALVNLRDQTPEDQAALLRGLGMNVLLLAVMTLFGVPWLYLCWLAAMIFTYPIIVRVRQIAEHAAVPDLSDADPRKNTRTTYANPLVRLLLCPHQVNYHVEHHLLASIPIYRLKQAHQILLGKGYFDGVEVPSGYINVMRAVTTP